MSAECRRFENKVVLVTGAARGIGFGIAKAFLNEGASVAINDINPASLEKAREELAGSRDSARTYVADVSNSQQVEALVEKILSEFGSIDVLVNNAGVATPTPYLDLKEEEWDRVMTINLKGAVIVSQQVLRHMITRNYGRIVMISSLSGKMGGVATSMPYSVSKGGLLTLTRQLAREFGKYNITCNAVAPSFVDTTLLNDLRLESKREELASLNVIRRLGTVEDVANAVLFLASDASSFITGETINVNGGRLMD
ncbi:MAG TPA: SDR family NAD(P)-dependent oxidoreductase [Nitrososphaerales archaeon]|nr:SDR family NAD(P)-dependent oxidoreductase [Nitrososphaerales archaeon]